MNVSGTSKVAISSNVHSDHRKSQSGGFRVRNASLSIRSHRQMASVRPNGVLWLRPKFFKRSNHYSILTLADSDV